MKIERRGDRQGTHRITISFSQDTYEALRDQSAKEDGYSIGGVARRVIDRGVAAGLLNAETPNLQGTVVVHDSLLEDFYHLVEKLKRADDKRLEGLTERLAINEQLISQMKRALEMNSEVITEQAATIQFYEHGRVRDVVPGSTPGTSGD